MKILSIDAWNDGKDNWEWNQWHHLGEITKKEFEALKSEKEYRLWFKREGYTTTANKRKVEILDDEYNKILAEKKTGRPLYAIEYGPEY